jgi:apolipoprotein D and lipocalin family protein
MFIVVVIAGAGYWLYKKMHYVYPLPRTATNVDLQSYAGNWYEIALIPNEFEKGCSCTRATYTVVNDYIRVENSCKKETKKDYDLIKGKAWSTDKSNSKLKVQFMWPFRGDYWILHVDKKYQYALVGGPSRKYLWVLARTTKIQKKEYVKLVDIAKKQGFDVTKLVKTVHNCK